MYQRWEGHPGEDIAGLLSDNESFLDIATHLRCAVERGETTGLDRPSYLTSIGDVELGRNDKPREDYWSLPMPEPPQWLDDGSE